MKKPKLKGKMMSKGKKPAMKKKTPKKAVASAMQHEDMGNTGKNKSKSRKRAESQTF